MKRVIAMLLLALCGGAHAASTSDKLDLRRLTEREREILGQTTVQTLAQEALVQRMLAECPAGSVGPLFGHYRRRDANAAFAYYSDFFDQQLTREQFDAAWGGAKAATLDCTKTTIGKIVESLKGRGTPPEIMGKYRWEAKNRQSGFIPATEAAAAEQLGKVLGNYALANAGPDGKWLMVRRFAAARHSNCKTVLTGATVLEARGVANPAATYTIDWRHVKGVWSFEESSFRTAELDADWHATGEVTKFLETGSYTMATSLLGPIERLRISCAAK